MGQEAIIGLLCFLGMFTLILLGVPIFVSMLLAAVVGFWIIKGPTFALVQSTNAAYTIAADYAFAVIPMFVLMGIIAGETGIAKDAYNAVNKWVMRIRGGVLMATIGANAVFGACSGVPTGGTLVFTKIALPQLEKYGYDKSISMGCIASAGVLATLIPPSIPIVFTCILVDLSIGKALIAGIVPGILTTLGLALAVYTVGVINPKKIPLAKDVSVTWRERFSSITLLWPVLLLFLLVVGGLYAGIFPPTVAGAIGAFGTLVYALVMRRLTWKRFSSALWETVVINAQIFPMLIAGFIFSRLVAVSGLAAAFNDLVLSVQLPPLGVMALVIIFYVFVGCVMELMSVLIITLPIVFPLLTGLGFDPYALCIITIFIAGIGALTPPIGMGVFVVAIAAKVEPIEVFKGVLPFFFVQLALVWLIIFFPGIATWLPNLLIQ